MAIMSQDRQANALERLAAVLEKIYDKMFGTEDTSPVPPPLEETKIVLPEDISVSPPPPALTSSPSGDLTSEAPVDTPLGKLPPADKPKSEDKPSSSKSK